MNRYDDALFIQMGASNPVAVAGTLREHMADMMDGGADHPTIQNDPALRLITHQLAHLMGFSALLDFEEYNKYVSDCKLRASDNVVTMWERSR